MDLNIFVYSDESGVFDYIHNEYYVFGGLITLGKKDREDLMRLYRNAESAIAPNYKEGMELKASNISTKHRAKLFRSLNSAYKFGVVIKQGKIRKEIFANKKSKQRYLDYAYKIGVKNALVQMINSDELKASDVRNIHFYVDEHTTATNGRYELREALLQEFKFGTFNWDYNIFYKPLFPTLDDVQLDYCNSSKTALVRAADIIANRIYHEVLEGNNPVLRDNMYIKFLPR